MTKSKAQEDMGLDYDPYKKEKDQQFSIHELLEQQHRIDCNLEGVEYVAPPTSEEVTITPAKMTKAQLQEALTEAGVEFDASAKKDELVELYSDWLADQQGEEEEEEQE